MKTVLIISHEPESARVISLAFELDGWSVRRASAADEASNAGNAELVIFDAIDGIEDLKKADQLRALARRRDNECRIMVILPRGMDEAEARKIAGEGPILVRRPYELNILVKLADRECAESTKTARPGNPAKGEAKAG